MRLPWTPAAALALALALAACEPGPLSIPTTPVLPPADRAGLLLDPGDLPAVRARVGRPPYAAWWATVRGLADQAVAGAPGATTLSEGTRARWAKAAAFAFVVEEDPARLAAARAALLAVGTGPDATINDLGPNSGPTSRTVLTASSHLQAACQAYDLVRDRLEADDRAAVEAALALAAQRVAASSASKPDVLLFRVNNWRTKAVSSLGIAALALPGGTVSPNGDTPARWLAAALEGVNQVLGRTITPGGWNREGAWYTTYSLGNLHPFLVAYRRTTGRDLFPHLERIWASARSLRQPNGLQPAFEDSLEVELPWHVIAPFAPEPGAYQDAWLTGAGAESNWANDDVKEVDAIVFHDDALAPEEAPLRNVLDVASGVARLAAGDAPASTVAFVNGAPDYFDPWAGGGHAHVDPLGLVVWAQGEALLVDSGYGPNGFSSTNRAYYVSAEAHNTATLDGQAPWLVAAATTLSYVSSAGAGSLAALRAPYGTVASPWTDLFEPVDFPAGGFERTVAVLDARTVVVTDRVSADAPRTLALLWHARGTRSVVAEGGPGAEVVWSRPRAGAPDTRLRLVAAASAPIAVARASGFLAPAWTQEEVLDYVRLEAAGAAELRLLTLLDLDGPAAAAREIGRPAVSGGLALVVGDGAAEETLLAGDPGTPAVANGVAAAARFARVRRAGGALTAALVDRGTALAVDGVAVLGSSAEISAALEREGATTRLVLGTVAAAPVALHVATGGGPPLAVTWQGVPLAFAPAADGGADFVAPGAGEIVLSY